MKELDLSARRHVGGSRQKSVLGRMATTWGECLVPRTTIGSFRQTAAGPGNMATAGIHGTNLYWTSKDAGVS